MVGRRADSEIVTQRHLALLFEQNTLPRARTRQACVQVIIDTMKDPHPQTITANEAVYNELDFSDQQDFADAARGFIGTVPEGTVLNAQGKPIFSHAPFKFLDEERAPLSANPSLWRLARLNRQHGLFQVSKRIFQVRGLDLANVTFIEGDTGVLVIDAGTFTETGRAARELYYQFRAPDGKRKPIIALIYSHSHTDHYGGVRGIIDEADVQAGKVQVIAPAGFMSATVAETMLAGPAMRRRAMYQFGPTLAPGPRSHIDSGLGRMSGRGAVGLIPPTLLINEPREKHVIDGVEIHFQLTPNSEAPAEMHFYFPGERVLNLAENACQLMHNLCPIRGAKTRDALAWSKYLDEALNEFAPITDVAIAQHHWPVWGKDRVMTFLGEQRDMYRYLHDQTLRLMSHGMTPNEIANELMMPNNLSKRWHTRGYYGAVAHNVRAVYAHYLGPYDGNPANLHVLPPSAGGQKYVEYMGGAEALLKRAQADFERGEFRWVVEVLNHLVFADPGNKAARALAADAMEQLGYQAESATWRNSYLLGARELREGLPTGPGAPVPTISGEVAATVPLDMFLDVLAVRVNGPKAQDLVLRFDWEMRDEGQGKSGRVERRKLTLVNGVLNHSEGSHGAKATASVSINRSALGDLAKRGLTMLQAYDEGLITAQGDGLALRGFLDVLDAFKPMFAIVEP